MGALTCLLLVDVPNDGWRPCDLLPLLICTYKRAIYGYVHTYLCTNTYGKLVPLPNKVKARGRTLDDWTSQQHGSRALDMVGRRDALGWSPSENGPEEQGADRGCRDSLRGSGGLGMIGVWGCVSNKGLIGAGASHADAITEEEAQIGYCWPASTGIGTHKGGIETSKHAYL